MIAPLPQFISCSLCAFDTSRMPRRDAWNILAIVLFLFALAIAYRASDEFGGFFTLRDLRFFDLVVVALAAFRILHLVTYDKILAPVRDYFDTKGKQEPSGGIHRYIDGFLECLWCTGMWSGLIAVALFSAGSVGEFIVFVFAVAGVASLLQLASHAFAARID